LLLLGGAFAKSAQAPLHVWLADAMAGPTPVSALIHAATMVTAGVYLLARLDWLYAAAPEVQVVIGICALVTLVVGAFLAVVQTDIKKLLAYSTLSNLALMFLGLSVGATEAGLAHLFGHAFFKALLFLAAGSIIFAVHHEQDIRKLQGFLAHLPITRIAVWVGCIGGAGLIPYFAAGFFTKEAVLVALEVGGWSGYGLQVGGHLLHYAVLAVESLSAIYMFRMLGYLSAPTPALGSKATQGHDEHEHHQELNHGHNHEPIRETSWSIRAVLATLALAAPIFGTLSANGAFQGQGAFWSFITGGGPLPEGPHLSHAAPGLIINLILASVTFWIFVSPTRREGLLSKLSSLRLGMNGPLTRKFYFDDVYAALITTPLKAAGWLCQMLAEKIFTGVLGLLAVTGEGISLGLQRWQTGKAQHYALYILVAAGLVSWFVFGK
jgi:NADH-quinone oxidoreductase subunit L